MLSHRSLIAVVCLVCMPALAADECRFAIVGAPSRLVRGASFQRFTFVAAGDSCKKELMPKEHSVVWLKQGDKLELKGDVKATEDAYFAVDLESVDRTVSLEPQDWEVSIDGKKAGTVRLAGTEFSVKSLSVSYASPSLDQKQDGSTRREEGSELQIAIVNPLLEPGSDLESPGRHGAIVNSVRINVPPALPTVSGEDGFTWAIQSASWDDIYFNNCARLDTGESSGQSLSPNPEAASPGGKRGATSINWAGGQCRLPRVDPLIFEIGKRQTSPLVVVLELTDKGGSRVLSVPLTLAAQSRRESLPLPIGSMIEVSCDTGVRRAISATEATAADMAREEEAERALRTARQTEAEARAAVDRLASQIEYVSGYLDKAENRVQEAQKEYGEFKQKVDALMAQAKAQGDQKAMEEITEKAAPGFKEYEKRLAEFTGDRDSLASGMEGLKARAASAMRAADEQGAQIPIAAQKLEEVRKAASSAFAKAANEIEQAKGWQVHSGSTRALPNDQALQSGQCRLSLDQSSPLLADPALFKLYGYQTIEVSVVREGDAVELSTVWDLEGPNSEYVLAPPAGTDAPERPYVVRASVSELGQKTVYRPGAFDAKREKVRTGSEFSFEARLRPRGPYGFTQPVRAFVTVPLNITGVRFPAAPRSLRKSSDAGHVQVSTLRVGLLGAIEPWNYDNGRTAWAMPFRFLGGMNLVDLGSGRLAPSVLVGASITAPLIDAPSQLGTSVAVGAFWEVDLRDQSPLRASHLLITAGFNIFSLFGAK